MAAIWLIEEIDLDSQLGHRQVYLEFNPKTGKLVRPDHQLGEKGRAEWDRVIALLESQGLDVVDGPRLLEHCLAKEQGNPMRRRGL